MCMETRLSLMGALQKKPYNCCNECLYTEYNTLPPKQLFNYQILRLVHRMIYLPDSAIHFKKLLRPQ